MSFQNILSQISIWSVTIPLVIGLIWIHKLNKDSKLVFGIVVLATIPQLIKGIIPDSKLLIPAYNLYTVCEFLLYFILFSDKFSTKRYKKIHLGTLVIFSILSLFFIFNYDFINKFISDWVCVGNLFYATWILLFILDQYEAEISHFDFDTSFIWFMIGLFYYSTCTFFIFSLWDYLKNNPNSYLTSLWIIHHVFNSIMYILFFIGFGKSQKLNYATR
jgi:hypothetical protein